MKHLLLLFSLLIVQGIAHAQLPKKLDRKMGANPIIFLDSVEVDVSALHPLNPFDISNIDIHAPKRATTLLGEKGVDGAVYVTTVKFAKQKYWSYFRSKSADYKNIVLTQESDSTVLYILNGEPLNDSSTGTLFLINDAVFKSLSIVDVAKLAIDNVTGKRYIVAIVSKRPKGLVKKKKG